MTHGSLRLIRERSPYLLLTAALVVGDRISKSWIYEALAPGERRVAVDGLLDLIHLRNTGIAFGLLDGVESPAKVFLLSGFAAVAGVVVVVYSVRSPASQGLLQTALALVLAGAVGNLYDRVAYGYVIDFLYFHLGDLYWPAFNLADSAITAGVGLLLLDMVRHEIRDRS